MHFDQEQRRLALDALNEAPPSSLFADPLEYIFADHFRQRTLCNVLDHIATKRYPDHELIKAAHTFLERDFGLHIQDEEEDLIPALSKRLQPDDEASEILLELSEEHEQDRIYAEEILRLLQSCLDNEQVFEFNQASKALLKRFADNERRHLTTENAIVLPIARARLTSSDILEMGAHMASRRDIESGERAQC